MVKVSKLLRWLFGYAAAGCGFALVLVLRNSFHLFRLNAPLYSLHRPPPAWTILGTPAVVIALALICPAVYATAWWRTGKGKGRLWAIAASLVHIGVTALFIGWRLLSSLLIAIGVAGLIIFSQRKVLAQITAQFTRPTSISGELGHRLLAFLARWGPFVAGFVWWYFWRKSSHLHPPGLVTPLVLIEIASLVTTTVHECGHAGVGIALGMKLRVLSIGPFQWRKKRGNWKFRFRAQDIFGTGISGKAGLIPTDLKNLFPNECCMLAGGPFANLCFGLLALCAALTASGHPWEPAAELLSLVTLISLISAIVNLIPVRVQSYYSDGAHIYNLLSRGPSLDMLSARASVTLTLITQSRARDYDIQALQRAALSNTEGHTGMILRLWIYGYFLDRGETAEAIQAMLEAEKIGERCYSTIRGELLAGFVFGHAILRGDAERARLWWDRMEARKRDPDSIDREWARAALLWVEGHHQEAREALRKGAAKAEELPRFGAYNFDRYHFDLLREAMKTSASPKYEARETDSRREMLTKDFSSSENREPIEPLSPAAEAVEERPLETPGMLCGP